MTVRIFQTLKSRLPSSARAESLATIDAVAASVVTFKTEAARIVKDARIAPSGRRMR